MTHPTPSHIAGKTGELVAELQGLSAYPSDAYGRAADALEAMARELADRDGEWACTVNRLEDDLAEARAEVERIKSVALVHIDEMAAMQRRAESAERQRDAAMGALRERDERVKALEGALTRIAAQPERYDDGVQSYGVGWAFYNVQSIAKVALIPARTALAAREEATNAK